MADSTGLQHYLPQVDKFLAWCRRQTLLLGSTTAIERAAADYLADLCYEQNAGIAAGRNLDHGLSTVFPELMGVPREMSRALKGTPRHGRGG